VLAQSPSDDPIYPELLPSDFLNGSINAKDGLLILGSPPQVKILGANETGKYSYWKSDEFGFRNPKGLLSGGPLDVLIVGDSFAVGTIVPDGSDSTSFIRKQIPKTATVSAGNNGPLAVLAGLREYLPATNPKRVVWYFFEGNDIGDLERELSQPLLSRYLDATFTQDLFNRRQEIGEIALRLARQKREMLISHHRKTPELEVFLAGFNAEDFLKIRTLRRPLGLIRPTPHATEDGRYDDFKMVAHAIRNEIGKRELYFVYLPAW
jgi:hypothetical protein